MPGFELFGEAEKKEVQDVLNSGVLMRYGFDGLRQGHWKAKELEKEIESNFDVKYAQLVSSGTAAVSLALASAGIGAGDEVIIPCFTFVASFESILAAGATPGDAAIVGRSAYVVMLYSPSMSLGTSRNQLGKLLLP